MINADHALSMSEEQPGRGAREARDDGVIEASRDRFAFLAEVSRCLADSLEYEATLTTVAGMALPYLHAWCIVDVITEDADNVETAAHTPLGDSKSRIRRVAVIHPDPGKQAAALALSRDYPPDVGDLVGPGRVMRTRRPEIVLDVPHDALVAGTQGPGHLGLLQALGVTAYVIVPMVARGHVLGAITFVTAEAGRRFGDADVMLAEDLARRAAMAVDNARLHAALAESEARFRMVHEHAPTGFALHRPVLGADGAVVDFEYTYINPAGGRLLGRAPAEIVGRRLHTLYPGAAETEVFRTYRRVAETGQPAELELMYQHAGSDVGLHLTVARVDSALAVTFSDITERLQADAFRQEMAAHMAAWNAQLVTETTERARLVRELEVERTRLAGILEQAPVAVAVLRGGAAGDLLFELVNPRYSELVPPGRAILGRRLIQVMPEMEDRVLAVLQGVLDTGVPFVANDFCIPLDRDGDGVPESAYFNLVYHPLTGDGEVTGVVAVATDVTELVEARRTAEAARVEAYAANQAKGEFLATMSHELRTPLNAIGGYAELLEMGIRGPITEAQREDLARIQRSQRHLLGLVNEVLNHTKATTGNVRYEVTDVAVCEALGAAETLVAPQVRAKGIGLTVSECPADLRVLADSEKLRQVLVNLLSNALKFTDHGGAIAVSCAVEDDQIAIRVSDTGIGIPADKIESIFEPFVQVRADLTRTHDGAGLGLSISRALARGMGGDLTVEESRPEVGSTFALRLRRSAMYGA